MEGFAFFSYVENTRIEVAISVCKTYLNPPPFIEVIIVPSQENAFMSSYVCVRPRGIQFASVSMITLLGFRIVSTVWHIQKSTVYRSHYKRTSKTKQKQQKIKTNKNPNNNKKPKTKLKITVARLGIISFFCCNITLIAS